MRATPRLSGVMRPHPVLGLAALALVPAVSAPPANACSVISGYRVPTNLELAERADTIILGTAESDAAATDGDPMGEVIVRPIALLKGANLPPEVRISGHLSSDRRFVAASNPRDLFNPNPGALIGGHRIEDR